MQDEQDVMLLILKNPVNPGKVGRNICGATYACA